MATLPNRPNHQAGPSDLFGYQASRFAPGGENPWVSDLRDILARAAARAADYRAAAGDMPVYPSEVDLEANSRRPRAASR